MDVHDYDSSMEEVQLNDEKENNELKELKKQMKVKEKEFISLYHTFMKNHETILSKDKAQIRKMNKMKQKFVRTLKKQSEYSK